MEHYSSKKVPEDHSFKGTEELESCGLLSCFYQLFGLSFWRHPFTAEDSLVSKWCNATFLQIFSHEETNSSKSRMFFLGWTIPLTSWVCGDVCSYGIWKRKRVIYVWKTLALPSPDPGYSIPDSHTHTHTHPPTSHTGLLIPLTDHWEDAVGSRKILHMVAWL